MYVELAIVCNDPIQRCMKWHLCIGFIFSDTKPGDKKSRSLNDVLMHTPYRHAKAKNMKIYTQTEIDSVTGMEKKRRQFWNEKADQLVKNKETRDQSKTALCGIIDVSWTMRKTSMLEAEAKKLMEDEKVLFRKDDVTSRKLGNQKKDTILKNVDRMSAAHQAVEEYDQKVTRIQKRFKEAETIADRRKSTQKYEREKLLMDGAYTELKRAQDALSKSIKVKRMEIENRLKVGTGVEDSEDAAPSTSGEI